MEILMTEKQLESIEEAKVEYLAKVRGILFITKAKKRKILAEIHPAEVWMDIETARSLYLAPEDYQDLNEQKIDEWLTENIAGKGKFGLYSNEKQELERDEWNIFNQSKGELERSLSNFKKRKSEIFDSINIVVKYIIDEKELKDSRIFVRADIVDEYIIEEINELDYSKEILEKANQLDKIYTNMLNQLFKIKCPHLERVHIELGKEALQTYKHNIYNNPAYFQKIANLNLPYNKETIVGIHKGFYKNTKSSPPYRPAQVAIVP